MSLPRAKPKVVSQNLAEYASEPAVATFSLAHQTRSSQVDDEIEIDADDEQSEAEDPSSGVDMDSDGENTMLTSLFSSEKQFTFTSTPAAQKTKVTQGRFLIFDKTPPKGYKTILRNPDKPAAPASSTKRKVTFADGFSSDEMQPSPCVKKRRFDREPDIGALELLSLNPIQRTQRPIKPMRSRLRSPEPRQHFSSSQFHINTSSQPHEFSFEAVSAPYGAPASLILGELSECDEPPSSNGLGLLPLRHSPSPDKGYNTRDEDMGQSWETYEVSASSETGQDEDSITHQSRFKFMDAGVQTTQSLLNLRPKSAADWLRRPAAVQATRSVTYRRQSNR